MPDEVVHRGLVGVVSDTTAVSTVNAATNSLTYRGYPVQDLAATGSFAEVAYLIWHGELPSEAELRGFEALEREQRSVPKRLFEILGDLPLTCHPMDVLRTAVSYLGACDAHEDDRSPESNLAKSISLFAKLPTIVAFEQRRRRGETPIPPDPTLSYGENFFAMCFGSVPDGEIVRSFDISMILYAEHGFNASTFTARVVTSTLADIYSAVTAAIGALKGPLHGGANEAVMAVFEEIGDPDRAAPWLSEALSEKRLIMGFGHRVYKRGDSRVPTMRRALDPLVRDEEGRHLLALYRNLEAAMAESRGIFPNLDYATGPAYHMMGFDTPMFTPIFVMSRITGWTAHVMEQLEANSLIRPISKYVGKDEREVPARAPDRHCMSNGERQPA